MEYRPLEGFVFAVSPFNFTAIAGNLPSSAALMGNVVLWKPASTAMLSAHYLMRLWEAAGLPPGVINLVYGSGAEIGDAVLASPDLAGIHFTGSTRVFNDMWRTVGASMDSYRNYPRIVGETGGKDFILAHPSADLGAVAAAIVRGSFEYQGQKCSAASRVYAPSNLWPALRDLLAEEVGTIKMGDVTDFSNFMGAVIDSGSFATQREAIEEARAHADSDVVVGGGTDDSKGFFVEPTVIETRDPEFRLLRDELFGPVVTAYVYDESKWGDTLELVDSTAPYGLTGAVFAEDRAAVAEASEKLRYAAGNFYVNDKPTGAVVGQQPFGGSRASGTNDKAGSIWNLIRWVIAAHDQGHVRPGAGLPLPVPRRSSAQPCRSSLYTRRLLLGGAPNRTVCPPLCGRASVCSRTTQGFFGLDRARAAPAAEQRNGRYESRTRPRRAARSPRARADRPLGAHAAETAHGSARPTA